MGHHAQAYASFSSTAEAAAASTSVTETSSTVTGLKATICPALPSPVNDASPIAGSLSFHHLSGYISIGFAIVATLIALALILRHAMHLSRPVEQIKIMRLIALIPTFAIISVFNIFLGTSAVYLIPWMNVCESISIMNFFLLIRAYLAEANVDDNMDHLDSVGAKSYNPASEGPPAWRVQLWALQYIFVALFCAVLTDITQPLGRYCLNSDSYHFAHLWVLLIRSVSVVLAVLNILRFTNLNKHHMTQQKPILKLVAFKLVVFLNVVQGLIFSLAGNHITPTTKVSYVDVTVGLPSLILSAEMVIFAVIFHFVYRVTPYKIGASSSKPRYQGGPLGLGAFFTAFNPVSVILEITKGY